MITKDKLRIYEKYKGHIERWDRSGKKKDKGFLTYNEFDFIAQLIQELLLVERGLASEGYKSQTMDKLHNACDSEETKQMLLTFVGKFE